MALSCLAFRASTLTLACLAASLASRAQTEVQGWYSMTAGNGEWVNHLARDFNASRKDDKIVPMFKGSNDESMTAAVAAFRASNAPHHLASVPSKHHHDSQRRNAGAGDPGDEKRWPKI